MAAIESIPYTPFPSFNEWGGTRFDPASVDRFAGLLASTKETAGNEALVRAVQTATKWAAVDTGAIEGLYDVDRGFTFTVALEAAAWANIHLAKGETAQRAIEDALAGYEYVLDLVTEASPISEVWIKQLHSVLCKSQTTFEVITAVGAQEHELVKGAYKARPNSPFNLATETIHEYCPVEDVASEMARLVEELRSVDFGQAHPVVQAAYAHYAFVCIHPFADGNGRVARALASAYLYRAPGVPLVVFADQKGAYIDALEKADAGDPLPLVEFLAERVVDTIQMVRTEMNRQPGPSLQERMKAFQSSLVGPGGLLHSEIDALAQRILQAFAASVQKVQDNSPLEPPLSMLVQMIPSTPTPIPEGYRVVPQNPPAVQVTVKSAAPATASVGRQFGVGIARPDHDGPDFVIYGRQGSVYLEVLLREVTPTMSVAFTYRSDAVAEDVILRMVDEAVATGLAALTSQGYRA